MFNYVNFYNFTLASQVQFYLHFAQLKQQLMWLRMYRCVTVCIL